MRVRFRTYCYGCRRGRRWNGRCLWSAHRWDWQYTITCDGRTLVHRQGFRSFERARRSAVRSWHKLTALPCIQADATCTDAALEPASNKEVAA